MLLVILIRKIFNKEGIRSFLISYDIRALKLFLRGLLLGILFFIIYVFIIVFLNQGQLIIELENWWETAIIFFAYGGSFLIAALFEEFLYRGYILQKLLKKVSPHYAVIITSILFGLGHYNSYLHNGYSLTLGIINSVMISVILSIIVIRTESLLFVIGWHFSWNLTQSLFLLEGNKMFSLLFKRENILTGSRFVPESGLLVSFVIFLFFIFIKYYDSNTKSI
ncbi:hypothetical protein C7957_1492 [Halanaerobium saccharolyticum]|uniref:CAAX prenyl protease 2/Lysostaphin resistance protein A-like domain-containing protein n=1 Tax=Halanaerobium saccharolyticum TaxID=43595 RepID=A0A4R6R760_9FIRM|nr:CPBP family intramembrane glutamic endopeptidase [Halanaerobium saccharolyticum]TDP81811.1 hypothetical protein C7957_1492 [Halanaerobium saccharolyticum]